MGTDSWSAPMPAGTVTQDAQVPYIKRHRAMHTAGPESTGPNRKAKILFSIPGQTESVAAETYRGAIAYLLKKIHVRGPALFKPILFKGQL